jgi:cytochrome d ubiquinol oxidase subunit II
MADTGWLQLACFVIVASIFYIFMALDGFDMGIGMALPFLSKEVEDKKVMLDIVWPFWDGNELWAVIGGAFIFTAFPAVFAALLGGLAPFIAVLLVFITYRAVAFEAWYKDKKRRAVWEWAFATGSFLLSFGFGALAGNLIAGLPLDSEGGYAGSPLTPFRPYPLLTGALISSAALFHGAAYLRKKTSGELGAKALGLARLALWTYSSLGLAACAATAIFVPGAAAKPMFWIGVAISAASMAVAGIALKGRNESLPFHASLAALAGIWIAAAAALFPNLIAPSGDGRALSIAQAASPDSTLAFLAVFSVAGIALVASFTAFVYRVFKGKASNKGEDY